MHTKSNYIHNLALNSISHSCSHSYHFPFPISIIRLICDEWYFVYYFSGKNVCFTLIKSNELQFFLNASNKKVSVIARFRPSLHFNWICVFTCADLVTLFFFFFSTEFINKKWQAERKSSLKLSFLAKVVLARRRSWINMWTNVFRINTKVQCTYQKILNLLRWNNIVIFVWHFSYYWSRLFNKGGGCWWSRCYYAGMLHIEIWSAISVWKKEVKQTKTI